MKKINKKGVTEEVCTEGNVCYFDKEGQEADVPEEKKKGERVHFDDIFCKLKFILESPDMDQLKRWNLLQMIEILHKELMQEINGQSLNQKLAKMETDVEELLREQSVYVKDSRPVARKEKDCLIYENAFRRILVV